MRFQVQELVHDAAGDGEWVPVEAAQLSPNVIHRIIDAEVDGLGQAPVELSEGNLLRHPGEDLLLPSEVGGSGKVSSKAWDDDLWR